MPLPETDVARVRRWVAEQNQRIGESINEMRVEMDWPDSNSRFHRYERLEPTATVDWLLAEIDADPIYVIWG